MQPTVIGTTTIPEGRTHRIQHEVACWYHQVALTPGTYDVTAAKDLSGSYVRLHARVPGVVTEAYTAALLYGVPVGTSPQYKNHPDVGQSREVVIGVGLDDVTLNDDARATIAKYWIASPSHIEFSGPGLKVEAHWTLVPVAAVWKQDYRIDPNDGGLSEFCNEAHLLAERVNALQAAGHDPDVWRVAYGDDRKPWFETPFEDHRPYDARKFRHDYGNSRRHWRYYRPDYDPRRAA